MSTHDKTTLAPKLFSTVREWAEEYIRRGLQVVPLEPRSKGTSIDDWPNLVFKPSDFRPDDNIGIRSVNGLVIVDLDCPEAVFAADRFLPPTRCIYGRPKKPRSKRLYLSSFEKTVALKDQETGNNFLEVRANHQDMCPCSQHPDGELLEWDVFEDPGSVAHDELLRANRLLATCAAIMRYYAKEGARHEWCLALSGTLKQLGIAEDDAKKILTVGAEWAHDTKPDDRLTEVRTTYARDDEPVKGLKALRHVAGKEFVKTLTTIWKDGRANADGFITNPNSGQILPNSPKNIRRALDKLGVELSFDSFANKPFVAYGERRVYLGDALRNRLWLDIEEHFGFLPTATVFDVVLQDEAQRNAFHPVRDYLASLSWDNKPRIDTWLIVYSGAADNEYVRAVSALVLIAAVRRVLQPGCKFDELLVLESGQGKLKSTALRSLCPKDAWFSDDLPLHVEAKQVIERTGGKWIIEASDLAGYRKAGIEHLKASLSRQVDGPVRLAYAHLPDEIPRQFIIIGTTNSHKYLKDSTGNRRFWPVRVEKFDTDGITRDRDQLWAEALQRESRGESIRLSPELYPLAALQQDRRRLEDAWEAPLSAMFKDGEEYRITNEELCDQLMIPMERRDDKTIERITGIMESLGFEHKKCRALKNADGKTIKRWCRGAHQRQLDEEEM